MKHPEVIADVPDPVLAYAMRLLAAVKSGESLKKSARLAGIG